MHKYREAEREKANQNKGTSTQDTRDEESNHESEEHTEQTEQQQVGSTSNPSEFMVLDKGKSSFTNPF